MRKPHPLKLIAKSIIRNLAQTGKRLSRRSFILIHEAQRIHYTSRRAEIRQALNPEPSRDYSLESYGADDELEVERIIPPQVCSHGGARPQTKAFAAETAALIGQSKQEINRQLAVGKAIDWKAGSNLPERKVLVAGNPAGQPLVVCCCSSLTPSFAALS